MGALVAVGLELAGALLLAVGEGTTVVGDAEVAGEGTGAVVGDELGA